LRFAHVVRKLKAFDHSYALNVPTQRLRTFFGLLARYAIDVSARRIAFELGVGLRRNKRQRWN